MCFSVTSKFGASGFENTGRAPHYKGDADAIRRTASNAKRAAVIGGSFLGMEIAIALVKLGVEVAVIERSPVLLPYLEAASLSAYVRGYAEKLGISVLLNDTAAALHGQDKVQAVETTSGRREQCAHVVVVAGGLGLAPVRPAIYRIMANRRLYGRVTILFGSHNPVDILYREELRLCSCCTPMSASSELFRIRRLRGGCNGRCPRLRVPHRERHRARGWIHRRERIRRAC